jgi:leucyl aminopeptidase
MKPSLKIEIKKAALENLSTALGVDTLVVFVAQKGESKNSAKGKGRKGDVRSASPKAYVEGMPKGVQGKVQTAADEGALTGAANETLFFRDAGVSGARHLLTVGVGDSKDFTHENLRQAAASAVAVLRAQKVSVAALAIDSLPHNNMNADLAIQALTEGSLLADYSFDDYKQKKEGAAKTGLEKLVILGSHKAKSFDRGVETGIIVAECVNFSRWLGDRPGNRMTPTILAEETVKAAKGTKLKVNVWDRNRIKSEKMGSFLSVSLGSSQEPKFIMMEYSGASSTKKPICLVGKGLTFDCGGISIKPAAGMEEMKYDMCGGAAVIAAMLAIARLKLKVNAIAFVPATENMAGPAANKPGDIVIARNGKSIEVNNTDAEGRLIGDFDGRDGCCSRQHSHRLLHSQ